MARKTLTDRSYAPHLGFAGHGGRPPGLMDRPHMHHEIELNYLYDGQMTYDVAGRRIDIPARRLVAFWASTPHQTASRHGSSAFYWFTIPVAWVLDWSLPDRVVQTLLAGQFLVARDESPGDHDLVKRWSTDLQRNDEDVRDIVLLEIEARFRRLAREASATPAVTSRSTGAISPERDRVAFMLGYIARHYADPISASTVAEAAGLTANHAAAIVRARCGTTLSKLITMHRCFAARRLLLTTRRPVLTIAHDCGFVSPSRFYDAFHQHYGQTPLVCRKSIESAAAGKR